MIFLFLYSVPYWGSLYFNSIPVAGYLTFTDEFLSPIGALYISMDKLSDYNKILEGFRPLLGFFIFQYIDMKEKIKK